MKLKMRFKKILDIYLGHLKNSNKSIHSIVNYNQDLKKFLIWYQTRYKRPFFLINSKVITNYRDFLTYGDQLQKPLAVSSRKRHLCSISNFFQYFIEAKPFRFFNLKTNPVLKTIHKINLKDEDIEHTKVLKEKYFQKVMNKLIQPKDILIFLLLYKVGLRIQELTYLKTDSISSDGHIDIFRKRGKRHRFQINEHKEILYYLQVYLEQRKVDSLWLFSGRNPHKPITTRALYSHILKIFEYYDLKNLHITPHSFRKGCATNLYHKTKDLLLVRNYLGHTDAKVTQTYIEY